MHHLDDVAEAGGLLAVEFQQRAVRLGPEQHVGQLGRVKPRHFSVHVLQAQLCDVRPVGIGHIAVAARRAPEPRIMVQEQHAVPAFGYVHFEGAHAAGQTVLQGFQRIFRIAWRRPGPVGRHQHAAGLPQAVEQFWQGRNLHSRLEAVRRRLGDRGLRGRGHRPRVPTGCQSDTGQHRHQNSLHATRPFLASAHLPA